MMEVKAEHIREAYNAAIDAAKQAVMHSGIAVRLAIECGKLLSQAKFQNPKNFSKWLAANVPEIDRITSWRWRKLSEVPQEILKDATSLRQAYITIGILPPSPPPLESSKTYSPNYYVHLVRAEKALLRSISNVDALNDAEKQLLKERLKPLASLYQQL